MYLSLNNHPTTAIPTLSLHDALPISLDRNAQPFIELLRDLLARLEIDPARLHEIVAESATRLESSISNLGSSEEHTSELQSPVHLVCRLLLEKKKQRLGDDMTKVLVI